MRTLKTQTEHGNLTSKWLPCPCKSSLVCASAKNRRLWNQSRRFKWACQMAAVRRLFSFAVVRQLSFHIEISNIMCQNLSGWSIRSATRLVIFAFCSGERRIAFIVRLNVSLFLRSLFLQTGRNRHPILRKCVYLHSFQLCGCNFPRLW